MTTRTHFSTVRRLLTCTVIASAMVGVSAGPVLADNSQSDHSRGNGSASSGRNTTGWHHIDPMGYNHSENSRTKINEQNEARRNHHQQRNNQATNEGNHSGGTGSTSWVRVPRADGKGWVVCRPASGAC